MRQMSRVVGPDVARTNFENSQVLQEKIGTDQVLVSALGKARVVTPVASIKVDFCEVSLVDQPYSHSGLRNIENATCSVSESTSITDELKPPEEPTTCNPVSDSSFQKSNSLCRSWSRDPTCAMRSWR